MSTPHSVRSLLAVLALAGGAPLAAQAPRQQVPAAASPANPAWRIARTSAAFALGGAVGTQLMGDPDAWDRDAGGFGRRLADQSGFYLLEQSSRAAIMAAAGWRSDEAPCDRGSRLRCAAARTLTAHDGAGRRRANLPLFASVALATGASVAWRPERREADDAWAFAATRFSVVTLGYVTDRWFQEWRRGRRASRPAP